MSIIRPAAVCSPEWEPDSLLADSFRATLSSILFTTGPSPKPRIMIVTSAVSGEGKTTVTRYLAMALAETRQRVLLIDADLRKPRVHDMFSLPLDPGLSNILQQGTNLDLSRCLHKTDVAGLSVIPAGSTATGLIDILYSSEWPRLLLRLRSEFDTILIDSPPMLQMPEARVLGRLADGVILVVRANSTLRESAAAAWRRLMQDRISVIGTVLNDWNPKYRSYYRYNYQANSPRSSKLSPERVTGKGNER